MLSPPASLVFSMDLGIFFPNYNELERLHRVIYKKKEFKGYGPGGVWDDVITWVLSVSKALNENPEVIPKDVTIPNFSYNGKLAERYQELFLEHAIIFLKALPLGIVSIFPIMFKGTAARFLLEYYGSKWQQHAIVTGFRIEDFNRPVGKGRKRASS
ncbi:hypothetical protein [Pseudomonas phage PA1C]|nr:hypothetical protein [Pseudomonas phage PA1C]